MKSFICSLLAIAVVLLIVPKSLEETGRGEFVESSRKRPGANWRGKPEKEMPIREMEQYAAGLGDDELWKELGGCYERWMAGERDGWNGETQPRLAIMLLGRLARGMVRRV